MRALNNGLTPKQINIQPLNVAAVGHGSQRCKFALHIPTAVEHVNDQVHQHTYEAPIVDGSGSKLPGLLGLRSLERHRCIQDCSKRQLHFVSDGDVEIKLPSGSVTVPLVKLPSGYLAMVIDNYERLQAQQGGVPTVPMQVHAHMPEHMAGNDTIPKQISSPCTCGDRYCTYCGQSFLTQRLEDTIPQADIRPSSSRQFSTNNKVNILLAMGSSS